MFPVFFKVIQKISMNEFMNLTKKDGDALISGAQQQAKKLKTIHK